MKSKKNVVFALIISVLISGSQIISPYFDCIFNANDMAVSASNSLKTVVPGGKTIGVTLNMDGVLVVNTASVICADGSEKSPAAHAGILSGDIIKSVNNTEITDVEQLKELISKNSDNPLSLTLKRQEKIISAVVTPQVPDGLDTPKIGVWVKDASSGIGTITFIDPKTNTFAALGHSICIQETENPINIDNGNIFNSSVVSVSKGEKGCPGELRGIFTESDKTVGDVCLNSESGLYGKLNDETILSADAVPIGYRNEVKIGPATILSNVSGQKVEEFQIEIIRLFSNNSHGKNMIMKVTDESLLNQTGGIVQGMSGSPILQNGKLVGAVTHVFVNDPTRGYGIFIENMLADAEKVN